MTAEQDPEVISIFLDEVNLNLTSLNEYLLKLEKDFGNAQVDLKDLHAVFRAYHSVKGASAMLGFTRLNQLAHKTENLLDQLRAEKIALSQDILKILFVAADALTALVKEITTHEVSYDLENFLATFENITHNAAHSAPISAAPAHKSEISADLVKTSGDEESVKAASGQAKSVQTMRIDIERLDKLMNMAGELVINKTRFTRFDDEIREILSLKNVSNHLNDVIDTIALIENAAKSFDSSKQGLLISRLQNLQLECSKIASATKKIEIFHLAYRNYEESLHQLDLVSNNIQRSVMSMRMVPVGPLFGRFKRVVRDICQENGKNVQLELRGEETEIDKRMIDELSDPLTHLVRNAVDHGIETGDEREAQKKPRHGTMVMQAFQRANRICIAVSDDGKGIDTKIVGKKALEKGLISEEDLAKSSEAEIVNMIFLPGFSTAKSVTNISGRGVGMDIVKRKIEELSGSIEIETKLGLGTRFILSLPLTLAIQKSLMCEIHGGIYALPIESVQEIAKIERGSLRSVQGTEVIHLRDKIIPVYRLEHFFPNTFDAGKTAKPQREWDILVILFNMQSAVALCVDRLIGEQDIVIKSLSRNMKDVAGLSGSSILGDGKIALILDVSTLINTVKESRKTNLALAGSAYDA